MVEIKLYASLTILLLTTLIHAEVSGPKAFLEKQLHEHLSARDWTMRTDGREAYFSSESLYGEISAIMRMEKKGKTWGKPRLASFSGQDKDLEPFLSPDGLRLFFASNRSNLSGEEKNFDLWVVERKSFEDDWSAPTNLGSPVNTPGNEFYPAVTSAGDLYFTSDGEGSMGKDDIFLSVYHDGAYGKPTNLGESINTEGYEFNAFVSPDGCLLLFTGYNRKDGLGSGDLYISQKDDSGIWSPAKNLGPGVNSDKMDYCPFIDSEGTLYFTSKRNRFSEQQTPVVSTKDWLQLINQPENGLSRIYQVKGLFASEVSWEYQEADAKEIIEPMPEPRIIQPMKTSREIVRSREIEFAGSFADRDLESFLEYVSAEAIFFANNTPLRGKEAIKRAWAPLIEADKPPFSWHPDVIEVLESGDLAISSGPIHDPQGKEVGRFNSIWRKEGDGQWRVIFDKGS